MSATQMLTGFVVEIINIARTKLAVNFLLILILGLLEGVGIVMLAPLLTIAGISPASQLTGVGQMPRQLLVSLGMTTWSLPKVLVIYTGIIALQGWLQRYQSILNTVIQETFDTYLSTSLYEALSFTKWVFFLKEKKANLTHVVTIQLMRVSTGTYYFLQLIAQGLLSVIQIGLAFLIAPYLTLLIIGCGLILFCGLHFSVREARRMGMDISDYTGGLFAEVTEHINGIKEVKSYGLEHKQLKRFADQRRKVEKTFIDFTRVQSQTDMLYKMGAAIFISIFCYTAIQVFQLEAQAFIIVIFIFARLWPRLASFHSGLQYVIMMMPAFQAVVELRSRCLAEREILVPAVNKRLRLRCGIRLTNVSFRYDAHSERYALRQADLYFPAGTTTAIVGVSGAGKSTLADLIAGLMLPECGEITVDETRINRDNMYSWRQSVSYVPQDAFLFNASIRENLLWASPDASDQEIWEALNLAAIDDFIRGLSEQLDTEVGDRGIRLSGGERQRIVLARALLRRPSLLVLDEATSALDAENEKRIQCAIDGLHGKLTILIIAHRLSTIRNADQIIVLEKGRIVERGTYRSLLTNDESRFYNLVLP